MRLYRSAANHLQFNPYPIRVPAYSTRMHPVIEAGLMAPIFDPWDANAFVDSRQTIAQLTKLVKHKIPFTICNDADVLVMVNEIEAYLGEIRDYPKTDEVKEFLAGLLPLREKLLKLRLRVLKLNPTWADQYRGADSGYLQTLYELLAASGSPVTAPTAVDVVNGVLNKLSPGAIRLPSLQEQLAAAEKRESGTAPVYDRGL